MSRPLERLLESIELEKKIVSFVFAIPYIDSKVLRKQSESSIIQSCVKLLQNDRYFLYIELTESVLKTCVYRLCCPALLTLDLAAPVEDASAPLDHQHLLGLVASAAAHQIATVNT